MEKNIINPVSVGIVRTSTENVGDVKPHDADNLVENTAIRDALAVLNGNIFLGDKKLKKVLFGDCGHTSAIIIVAAPVVVPEICLTVDGLKLIENETDKQVILRFAGDGLVYAYVGVQDEEYQLEVMFDNHSWKIEWEDYALNDLVDKVIEEYNKFPIK